MAAQASKRRLVTIAISHYCEKARWALDRAGLGYVESAHYPNVHYLESFAVARSPRVPILVDDGRVIADSTAILRHADGLLPPEARLFPEGPRAREVEALEDRFDEALGPPARLWAYWGWFERMPVALAYAGHGTPRLERALAPLLSGLMRRMTSARFRITPERAAEALVQIDAIFEETGARLADGRPYLAGERFTAADLAFAALSAPVLLPPGHGAPLPPAESAPPAMRAEIERLRGTPAGAFALRLYARERRETAEGTP